LGDRIIEPYDITCWGISPPAYAEEYTKNPYFNCDVSPQKKIANKKQREYKYPSRTKEVSGRKGSLIFQPCLGNKIDYADRRKIEKNVLSAYPLIKKFLSPSQLVKDLPFNSKIELSILC